MKAPGTSDPADTGYGGRDDAPRERRAKQRARHLAERTKSSQYHQARVLILLAAACDGGRELLGLTKLAKLDFLLRYPVFLSELIEKLALDPLPIELLPRDIEERAVESTMIRYKFGPWDTQYYEIIGALVGRGLVRANGNTRNGISLTITPAGRAVSEALCAEPDWDLVQRRAAAIINRFGRYTGNRIKTMIYVLLPDVVDRPIGSVIQ